MAGGALVLLLILGVLAAVFLSKTQPDKPASVAKTADPEETTLEMNSFMIDFGEPGQEVLLRMSLSLTFSNAETKREIMERSAYFRDLIYRFMQSQKAADLRRIKDRTELQAALTKIINGALKQGQVTTLFVLKFSFV